MKQEAECEMTSSSEEKAVTAVDVDDVFVRESKMVDVKQTDWLAGWMALGVKDCDYD